MCEHDANATRPGDVLAADQMLVWRAVAEAVDRFSATRAAADLLHALIAQERPGRAGVRARAGLAARLPLLTYIAVGGDPQGTAIHQIAAALAVVETGIYLVDAVLDNEVPATLPVTSTAEVLLGAMGLLCHLPYRILGELGSRHDGGRLIGMLADGLAVIGAGELDDLRSRNRDSAQLLASVVRKTGERRALYAAFGAVVAGAPPDVVARYEDFGRALGVARQLRSDLGDLFGRQPSRDLANGTVTVPLALYREIASAAGDAGPPAAPAEVPADGGAQDRLRAALRETGVLRTVVGVIESSCREARSALDDLRPRPPAAEELYALVDLSSVVGERPAGACLQRSAEDVGRSAPSAASAGAVREGAGRAQGRARSGPFGHARRVSNRDDW